MAEPLVLVVDDTPINCTVTAMLLRQLGYRPLMASSGMDAIELVRAHPVELVLMDCQMPGMDGFEAAQRIARLVGPDRRMPILALTGADDREDRERSRAAGMVDHLAKPLQMAVLRAALDRWLPVQGAAPPPTAVASTTDGLIDRSVLAAFDRMRPGSSAVLLGIYLKDLAASEHDIAAAVADGDLATVARLAHKVKGASLTVGAQILAAAMKELELVARSGSLPACTERWRQVVCVLGQTRNAITAGAPPAPPAPPPWPAGRASAEVLAGQRALALRSPGLVACMDAMPGPAMLLNPERQIVAVNSLLLRVVGANDATALIGKRPGELFGCLNAKDGPDGCGTAPACSFCGAVSAIMSGMHDQMRTVREARLSIGSDTGHNHELEVTASPISLDGQRFIVISMRDIADEKRRQVLERLFFHDVLNSVGGIHGLATQLAQRQVPREDEADVLRSLVMATQQVVDEIQFQRLLVTVESGKLQVDLRSLELEPLLREVCDSCAGLAVAADHELALGALVPVRVRTDRVLFRRVLGNLVKNALEATPAGGRVTISSRRDGSVVECVVHNPGTMPSEVQSQIFQRSFTTKGKGHGLGTWSAKLFGERHLGGQLRFTSDAQSGTELVFSLPVEA